MKLTIAQTYKLYLQLYETDPEPFSVDAWVYYKGKRWNVAGIDPFDAAYLISEDTTEDLLLQNNQEPLDTEFVLVYREDNTC